MQNSQQVLINDKEGWYSLYFSKNTKWKYLREYKLLGDKPSYEDLSFPSKVTKHLHQVVFMELNLKSTHIHVKFNQVKSNTISYLIFKYWKISMPIYTRHVIWKYWNMNAMDRSIPCRYVIRIELIESLVKHWFLDPATSGLFGSSWNLIGFTRWMIQPSCFWLVSTISNHI